METLSRGVGTILGRKTAQSMHDIEDAKATCTATGSEIGKRVVALDGWRGMSILLVLIGHFFPVTLKLLNLGTFGVECFFVLSGRLMAEILFVRHGNMREFYLRRLSRITPAFWVFILISWMLWSRGPLRISLLDVVQALTFTYNYFSSISRHHAEIIDHVWSLCVEEHTYIVLGIVALVSRFSKVRPIWFLLFLCAFSATDLFITGLELHRDFAEFWRTDCHMLSIVLGSVIYIAIRRFTSTPKWLFGLAPTAFALALAMSASHLPSPTVLIVVSVLLSAAVGAIEYSPPIILTIMLNRGLRLLGALSFSLYLWQEPFFKMAMLHSSHAYRFLMLISALLAGTISFSVIERPSRRWLNRLIASSQWSNVTRKDW